MNAVRPVFGVAFAERGVVFGVVFGLCSANAVGKRGLCSANACVRPKFGESGSASAVRQTGSWVRRATKDSMVLLLFWLFES